jgi:hypothetical protein
MKTRTSHTLNATELRANKNWSDELSLIATEVVGGVETEVVINVTPAQLKNLVQKSGRNALIEAKVIRGKKQY